MTPMEPIPETVQAARHLEARGQAGGLLEALTELAEEARAVVPDLVSVSITRHAEEVSFTVVATDGPAALLDAVQYAAGGPCLDTATLASPQHARADDVLDEQRWRLFAQATAAEGIRSTLSLPQVVRGRVAGSVNLYASSPTAFDGHHEELAAIFGAVAAGAVTNADLAFTTRRAAEVTAGHLHDQDVVEAAVQVIARQTGVGDAVARRRLAIAAEHAGVSVAALARIVVETDTETGQQRGDDG
ncbi:GAF domain-containing protein [Nocardioides pantholopis]|uniref:GAF domain-containing protein n=1 Tax=Nocardioides pantholopis TaxID=2483798 RepID=UPI000FDCD1E2|nr:GAF domain-containing protein [Nocardioides pantholopis]